MKKWTNFELAASAFFGACMGIAAVAVVAPLEYKIILFWVIFCLMFGGCMYALISSGMSLSGPGQRDSKGRQIK